MTDESAVRGRPVKDLGLDTGSVVAVGHRVPVHRIQAVVEVLHDASGAVGTTNAEGDLEFRSLAAKAANLQRRRSRPKFHICRHGNLHMEAFDGGVPQAVIGLEPLDDPKLRNFKFAFCQLAGLLHDGGEQVQGIACQQDLLFEGSGNDLGVSRG